MATRGELVKEVGERYRSADRESTRAILDGFVAVTGFHRKNAMRLLRAKKSAAEDSLRGKRRIYDEAARTALVVLWEAADRLCGKRLRPLIPILLEAMERHGHLNMAPDVKTKLTTMSAATIDRALRLRLRGVAPRQAVNGSNRRIDVRNILVRQRHHRPGTYSREAIRFLS
jgi:hypothetical protein